MNDFQPDQKKQDGDARDKAVLPTYFKMDQQYIRLTKQKLGLMADKNITSYKLSYSIIRIIEFFFNEITNLWILQVHKLTILIKILLEDSVDREGKFIARNACIY